MAKFRKKPVVIEAFHLTQDAVFNEDFEWPEWAQEACERGDIWVDGTNGVAAKILTREGEMTANFNDWIIRGIKAEIYPCKPDIFAATYEPVVQAAA